jgi:hypothetical protein
MFYEINPITYESNDLCFILAKFLRQVAARLSYIAVRFMLKFLIFIFGLSMFFSYLFNWQAFL